MFYQGDESNLPEARTVTFYVLAFAQFFYSLACRSNRYTLPELGLVSNPYLFGAIAISALAQLSIVTLPFAQSAFESVTNLGFAWVWILVLALAPATVVELIKIGRSLRKFEPRSGASDTAVAQF